MWNNEDYEKTQSNLTRVNDYKNASQRHITKILIKTQRFCIRIEYKKGNKNYSNQAKKGKYAQITATTGPSTESTFAKIYITYNKNLHTTAYSCKLKKKPLMDVSFKELGSCLLNK